MVVSVPASFVRDGTGGIDGRGRCAAGVVVVLLALGQWDAGLDHGVAEDLGDNPGFGVLVDETVDAFLFAG